VYYYRSIENKNDFNNVEWLIPKLKEVIDVLVEKKINIVAITTDNENLMKATRNKLKEIYPILIIIPCSAHIIQLCLKKICNIEKIKIIIDETIETINLIKNNKANKNQLENLQLKAGIIEPLKLIKPIEIRWTSLINCMERLLKLKEYTEQIVKKNDNFWVNLNFLYLFLEPFRYSIEQIQK